MIRTRWFRGLALLVGVSALVAVTLATVMIRKPWQKNITGARTLRFPNAAVASNGYECAQIGKDILLKNGSAADAAIATLFCEGVSCTQCMGLGGGFLLTYYDRQSGHVDVLNAREAAPGGAYADIFDKKSPTVGGLAVAVPGELRGYGALHRRYGKLPWAELVLPTAKLCRDGHVVNQYLARSLAEYKHKILAEYSLSSIFVNPDTDDVYEEGDIIKRPALARTLYKIAEEGPDALHEGSLTDTFVDDLKSIGGIIDRNDMFSYRPKWQSPIKVPLKDDLVLYTTPLPGSGAVLAFILNVLNGFIGGEKAPYGSNLSWQRIVETFKYAYSWRTALGDDFNGDTAKSNKAVQAMLLDLKTALEHRALVTDNRTYVDWKQYGAIYSNAIDFGTAHVVVIAPNGDTVSVTSTINYSFGAQRRSPNTGIIYNNQMDDFSIPGRLSLYGIPPSPANMFEGYKQPLSSMVPSLVLDGEGRVRLAVGAAGGTRIITQVALVLLGTIMEGANFTSVMKRPRLHHQLMPMEIQYEPDFNPQVIKALRSLGHATTALKDDDGFAAVVGAALDRNGFIVPQTDRRRPGSVAGF